MTPIGLFIIGVAIIIVTAVFSVLFMKRWFRTSDRMINGMLGAMAGDKKGNSALTSNFILGLAINLAYALGILCAAGGIIWLIINAVTH